MGCCTHTHKGRPSVQRSERPVIMPEGSSKFKELRKNVIAGGVAGVSEILVMYPLDVVKTRQQLNTGKISGVMETIRGMVRAEGASSLYRGIISPIMAEAPKRAWKFTANQEFRNLYKNRNGEPIFMAPALAGASAGITEALINCPFEVVKVRMQAVEGAKYKGVLDAVVQTAKTEGVTALYRGLEAQMWRNGVWNGTYFALIASIKERLPTPESNGGELLRNFAAGVVGGTVATMANTPFDTAKTRLQNTSGEGFSWKRSTLPTVASIAQTEGIAALYKGFVPRIMRLGPGGGIMILAFDFVRKNID